MESEISDSCECYVYIISVPSGPIKIGIAEDVESRASAIQTGNHEEISVKYTLKCKDRVAAKQIESALHLKYSNKNIRLEWFNIPYEDAIQDIEFCISMSYMFKESDGERIPNTPNTTTFIPVVPERKSSEDMAKDIFNQLGKVSISLLQRRLRIGYTTAIRIIESLEESGFFDSSWEKYDNSAHAYYRTSESIISNMVNGSLKEERHE